MLPVGPLMIEHRLIERMIALMAKEAQRIEQGLVPDVEFIRTAVDFIKTYADRLHHGKEEGILFRDLAKKQLSAEYKRIIDELIKEHVFARDNTRKLVEALNKYLAGGTDLVKVMAENMGVIAKFYPKHIEKEDKHFFLPVINYFTKDEQSAMLAEFNDFDRQFIHVTYKNIVSEWERK
ncbi:MAG: hemerythrin domain-containing protein [Candidatus Omnitrophica bacterium]|jgi:hemerythrin-like domain-containing protein|nr:hemerythrin domain-containing protein [Candidatus Omnitrophota bacterium]